MPLCLSRSSMRPMILAGLFAVTAILVSVGLSGCITARPDTHGLDATAFNHVQDICRSTIGVDASDVHFDVCVDELASILQAEQRSQVLARANAECMVANSKDDSQRALCVLQHDQPAASSEPKKSYYSVSNDEIHRRIEASCAKLGLNPAYVAFDTCVSSIQAGFASADMPPSN